jgi:gliding motility-associated-like protein
MLCSQAQAQLKADFTVDKIGGCAPLTVSFTNTSSGYSPNVIYKWDLGNGNTSSLANAGAIYKDERVYTVTLTVQDGSQTSVKTQNITVYSKPAVDFSANVVKGCLPFKVTFTSNSTAGSGNISSYYWDFGDGSTQQGYSNTQQHTYLSPQLATVSLTVANNFGCHTTVQKKDIVQVIPSLTASFSADKRILCRETDPVQFTNNSAGPGTLTYSWDFGDGSSSTDRNPSHVFNRRGIYTVKLTVNSSEGCTVTSTQTGYINVATFTTDFSTPGALCSQSSASFTNVSSPQANNSLWEVDRQVYSWYGDYFSYHFQNPGTYKIKLTNTYGTCVDSAVKNIVVKPTPATNGFIATVKGFCGAPVGVDFKDTTPNATYWQWNLDWTNGNNQTSTKQAFTHTYTENRLYHVSLKVTNTEGCTKEIYQAVNLPYPTVQISRISSSSNPPNVTCGGSIVMKFGSTTTEPITQFRWEFGDGGTSTEAEPTHTFSTPGDFQVKLHYTTANGCTGTAYYNSVTIHRKPEADFKILGSTNICGNTEVVFSSLTPGNLTGMNWYVDGNNIGQGNFSSLPWTFEDKGKHTIKLIAFNGMCSDTVEKIDYVEVFPPFTKISGVQKTCEGTRGLVVFSQASREAHSWKWDFGDGNSVTLPTDQASVSHTYAKTGKYMVTLTTTNGTCTVSKSLGFDVMLKTDIKLSAPASICIGSSLDYTLTNLQDNPVLDPWNQNYLFGGFLYEDGTPFTGYHNSYYIDKWPNFNGYLSQPDTTKRQIRAIIVSNWFGCRDTTNFVPFKVVGSQAAFDINDATVCFNSPVTFSDRSTSTGTTIKRWEWNFGDGQSITTTQPGNVSHSYPNPGVYYATLRISDDKGCSSSTSTYTQYVTVTGPKAAFTPSGTNVPLNTTVSFYNYTNSVGAYNTTFAWDFGDGSTSTAYSPSYTYTRAGTYTVKLSATDAVTGCSSEATETIIVRDFNTAFNFNTSYITAQSCPPVLVRFNNTSINFTSVTWDFGDGIRVNNVNYPSHIYDKPGKYIITLYVYGPNGLKGTYTDSVVVQQPRATMQADDLEGCIGNIVTLHAKADSTKSYTWDFGDGYVVTTTDSFAVHSFKTPGTYTPSLLIKDANGCATSTAMTDKIIIRPDPVVNISPAQPIVCLGQGTPLQASGGVTYTWSPATGLSNSTVASPVANPAASTTYTVQVADDIGCQSSGSVMVTVVQPVTVAVPADLSVCAGNSVTIPASGAVIYNWINNTVGLNDTHIANPTAKPGITTTYTVTGSDAHQCFTDTAEVTVRVLPLPVVDAGIDQEVQAGTPVNLAPTFSPDVVQWTWTPAAYLNCSNCPNPISTPLAQTKYVLTVKNGVGCTAKDSLTIRMICDEARVAVPNAFTPNGDGHNDEFIIKGISVVKHLLIFNRWGQKVFERSNFIAADRNACWNGTLNGYPASEGTYVYFIEMECPGGGVFTRKGSFVLVR